MMELQLKTLRYYGGFGSFVQESSYHEGPFLHQDVGSFNLNLGQYKCDQCNRVFSNQTGLLFHRESVHEGRNFRCKCGRVYKYRTSLHKHWRQSKQCAELPKSA